MPKATAIISPFFNLPVGEIVDRLGAVKAEIADLETREKTLRAELLKRCVFEAEGVQYAAAVTQGCAGPSTQSPSVLRWATRGSTGAASRRS